MLECESKPSKFVKAECYPQSVKQPNGTSFNSDARVFFRETVSVKIPAFRPASIVGLFVPDKDEGPAAPETFIFHFLWKVT